MKYSMQELWLCVLEKLLTHLSHRKDEIIMNCKKYRICLMLLVLALLAGTAFYYMTNEKDAGEPKDGMLVQEVISEESRNYA